MLYSNAHKDKEKSDCNYTHYTLIFQCPGTLSDLHEETSQQGFFYIQGVVPGPKGGH